MPLLKHAIKKMRQDKKRTERNKAKKTAMRTVIKKARTNSTLESLSAAFSKIDKAAKTHLIHKNKASRMKSRLAKAIAKLTATESKKATTPAKVAKKPTVKATETTEPKKTRTRTTKKTAEAAE